RTIGEELVGAYLMVVEGCDHVLYNVRPPGGKIRGLDELDVIGLNLVKKKAYLCEVTTHLRGFRKKSYAVGTQKVRDKFDKQKRYAKDFLGDFSPRFEFWSPYVARGQLTQLQALKGLNLIVNQEYTIRVNKLRQLAQGDLHPTNNPAFRLLQILENLRPSGDE
ncbi:beta-lactamase superfamily hydrolase, partial [mine drainage metagenome]